MQMMRYRATRPAMTSRDWRKACDTAIELAATCRPHTSSSHQFCLADQLSRIDGPSHVFLGRIVEVEPGLLDQLQDGSAG